MPAPVRKQRGLVEHLTQQAGVVLVNNVLGIKRYYMSADLLVSQVHSQAPQVLSQSGQRAVLNAMMLRCAAGANVQGVWQRGAAVRYAHAPCKVRPARGTCTQGPSVHSFRAVPDPLIAAASSSRRYRSTGTSLQTSQTTRSSGRQVAAAAPTHRPPLALHHPPDTLLASPCSCSSQSTCRSWSS